MGFLAKKMFDNQVDGLKKSGGQGDDEEEDEKTSDEKKKGRAQEKADQVPCVLGVEEWIAKPNDVPCMHAHQ